MTMEPSDPETEELLRALERGEEPAAYLVLDRHRDRLRRMVASRMDRRLSSRIDPSDVVQETLIQAGNKLPRYLREPRIAVYPWLRSIASERLIQLGRLHLRSSKRSVRREECGSVPPSGEGAIRPVDGLVASGTSPSGHLLRDERRERLLAALGEMTPADREILVLRYLEQRPFEEIAALLGVGTGGAKMRHLRALKRLRDLLGDVARGDDG